MYKINGESRSALYINYDITHRSASEINTDIVTNCTKSAINLSIKSQVHTKIVIDIPAS